jgi:hypothetical protein
MVVEGRRQDVVVDEGKQNGVLVVERRIGVVVEGR